ncbi:MAG: serine/threonine-protein kinase [Gemmataceae bacterium]
MRFVDGQTLTGRSSRTTPPAGPGPARLGLARLLDAFVAVCRAVAFAHSQGVIHRDLKGPNVVLGEYGEVFVLDWGLAKRTGDPDHPAGPDSGPLPAADTPPGSQVGTPAYMAPELAAGGPADRRTDVYALGCILYTILTGHPPVDGATPQEVLEKVRAVAPPPPRTVAPDAPPALDAVCQKAMARAAADRYASADALAEDVRRWLADEPVTAYPEPWAARAGRWARRHRSAVVAAGVALATATVGLAASTALVWREERKTAAERDRAELLRERAEQEWERAEANLTMAHAISRQVIEGWVEGRLPAVAGSELVRRDLTDFVLGRYVDAQTQRPGDPATAQRLARLYRYSANLHRLTNSHPTADRGYREAVRFWREQAAADPADPTPPDQLSQALWDHAELLRATGRRDEADAAAAESVELAARLQAARPGVAWHRRSLAVASQVRAELLAGRGRFGPAAEDAARAVALMKELQAAPPADRNGLDPVLYGSMLTTAAVIERDRGRPAAALPLHVESMAVLQAARTAGGPNLTDANHALGWAVLEQARTWTRTPEWRAKAEANLTKAALPLADGLADRHPAVVIYRELGVAARLARGSVREEGGRTIAAAWDFTTALNRAERLAAAYPDVPAYRRYAGEALAGLARTAPDRSRAGQFRGRAVAALRAAAATDPADVRTAAALTAAERGP